MTSPTQLPTKPARGEGFQGRQGPQWQAVGDVPTGSDRCTQFDSPSAPRQLASSSRRRSCNQSRAADLLVLTPGYAPFRPKLLLELASRAPVEFAPVSGRISRRSKCQQPVQGLPLACKRKPRFRDGECLDHQAGPACRAAKTQSAAFQRRASFTGNSLPRARGNPALADVAGLCNFEQTQPHQGRRMLPSKRGQVPNEPRLRVPERFERVDCRTSLSALRPHRIGDRLRR